MSSNIFLMENFSKSKLDPDLKMNVSSPNFLSHINASVFLFVVANKKIFVANVTILVASWSTVQLYDSIIFKTQHYYYIFIMTLYHIRSEHKYSALCNTDDVKKPHQWPVRKSILSIRLACKNLVETGSNIRVKCKC